MWLHISTQLLWSSILISLQLGVKGTDRVYNYSHFVKQAHVPPTLLPWRRLRWVHWMVRSGTPAETPPLWSGYYCLSASACRRKLQSLWWSFLSVGKTGRPSEWMGTQWPCLCLGRFFTSHIPSHQQGRDRCKPFRGSSPLFPGNYFGLQFSKQTLGCSSCLPGWHTLYGKHLQSQPGRWIQKMRLPN